MSVCVAQETYAVNSSNQYALKLEGKYVLLNIRRIDNSCEWADEKYKCEDGHAVITNSSWVLLCPPNEEVVSRSSTVLNTIPSLSPSTTVGKCY